MTKKVLVTGGAGFIGSTLVRGLLTKNYEVTVLDSLSTGMAENLPQCKELKLIEGDVRDYALVSKIVRKHPFVMHLAAHAFIPFSYEMPLEVAQVNSLGSLNVLKACVDNKVKRLVHVSSSEVYGSAQYVPMDEKHPIQPYSTYSAAKVAADLWAQSFFWEHKLPVVILRPFNTYGPRESLPYFIPEIIRQYLKEPIIRVGNLETSRDFTYVDDNSDAMIKALETEDIDGEIINVGANQTHRMKDILALIAKDIDAREKPVMVDNTRLRPRDVDVLITDNAKAHKLLKWLPATSFEDGIQKTIEWYTSNDKTWGYEKHGWKWRY
jgi:nucleoside-diphosphate-sugar epimerase